MAQLEDQQNLTPELVAALSRSADAPAAPLVPPARSVPLPTPPAFVAARAPASQAPAHQAAVPSQPVQAARPMEVAALPPRPAAAGSRSMQFGDGFDAPHPTSAAALAAPGKGGRTAGAGQAGQASSQAGQANQPGPSGKTAPLTGDMLAKWALNSGHSTAGTATIKAPRVVTRTLDGTSSSAAYSNGFKPVSTTVAIDTSRFGTANP